MTSNTPETYVLVVSVELEVFSWDIRPLIGTRYRNLSALGEAVEHILGTADGWELYTAVDFCEKWNTCGNGIAVPDPSGTYIAFLEVEHDE